MRESPGTGPNPGKGPADPDHRDSLEALVARARDNERSLRRFQEQELRIIAANGFRELVETLLFHHRKTFGLDSVALVLVDPEYEIRRAFESAKVEVRDYPDLIFAQNDLRLSAFYGGVPRPLLGKFDAAKHGFLFPRDLPLPGNMALLPLARHGRIIGSLNLGSNDPNRFTRGLATDFLERLAAVVAVCVENVCITERLKNISLTDPLTGVHNRRYFDERLREETGLALRRRSPLVCLLLDVDHFKRINDGHGHQVGDWVLREVAGRIKSQLRLSDSLSRYGGEEFAALLAQTDEPQALAIAERIRRSIADRPFELPEQVTLTVTLSVGLSAVPAVPGSRDLERAMRDLVEAADRALYRAKDSGRNRVVNAATLS